MTRKQLDALLERRMPALREEYRSRRVTELGLLATSVFAVGALHGAGFGRGFIVSASVLAAAFFIFYRTAPLRAELKLIRREYYAAYNDPNPRFFEYARGATAMYKTQPRNHRASEETHEDAQVAATRSDYRKFLSADSVNYQERIEAAQAEIEDEEAEAGIEELRVLLGASSSTLDPNSPESRQAMNYAGFSVIEVFRMIGPPPPGTSGPPCGGGGVPDSGADIPTGGRRG
ncbi:hypothetical protein ACIBCS_42245 [Streptomyces phaeochromogenes]|uniref:hypothetical protein n=1 Tax=Streptomyces phaeochromogenes TaxID=1923 RepID=UPI0033F2B954